MSAEEVRAARLRAFDAQPQSQPQSQSQAESSEAKEEPEHKRHMTEPPPHHSPSSNAETSSNANTSADRNTNVGHNSGTNTDSGINLSADGSSSAVAGVSGNHEEAVISELGEVRFQVLRALMFPSYAADDDVQRWHSQGFETAQTWGYGLKQ